MLGLIASGDHRLMRRVNRWKPPRWIRLWMILATRAGDGWLWYGLGVLVLGFGGPSRFAAVTAAGISCGIGAGLFLVLKRLAGRKRPCTIASHCWAKLLPPDQFSFPSGHSICAFAFALSIGLFEPSLMCGLLFCALSVAISRIMLGLHYLSDVMAGSLIGAGLGYACHALLSGVL
jgi:undecaprenyl-diphosphatase